MVSTGQIVAKGIMWSANKLNRVPQNKPGVIVLFDKDSKITKIIEHENISMCLREEWWKKNFWNFSWFVTSPPEYRFELLKELETKKDACLPEHS